MVRTPLFFGLITLFLTPIALADNTQDISSPDLTKASWMWITPNAHNVGGDVSFYRFKFRIEQPIKEATILITADNGYELYINNKMIAEEASPDVAEWSSVERFRIENNLIPRTFNCIAIKAESLGGNACGLIVAIKIVFEDGEILEKYSGNSWLSTEDPSENWWEPDHDDSQWKNSFALVPLGGGPWGNRMVISKTITDPSKLVVRRPIISWMRRPDNFTQPDPDFVWLAGIVYLQGRAPDNSTHLAQTNFRIGATRAAWENDVPAPSLSGNKMFTLIPASPDGTPKLILDAGAGWIGFPVSSFDGKTIYFSMAPAGETFYHLYSIQSDGTNLKQLTSGKWHDIDPCPLPDDSIVFTSTRTGSRDEYHANPARSLFRLNVSDGSIKPITYHVTADTDARLMADGRIAFVRYDNFLERAKVESHIHCVRPDGTAGEILLGPDRGAIGYDLKTAAEHNSAWLRNYGFGAPSPLPNGRIAALSHAGPVITIYNSSDSNAIGNQKNPDTPQIQSSMEKPIPITVEPMPCNVSLIDMSPLPDNRILAATARNSLAVVDPETGQSYKLLQALEPVHSANFLGEKPKPRIWPNFVDPSALPTSHDSKGILYCGNVFYTKQTNAEWARVRAVRIYKGQPLTLRSARHQYGHIGSVGVDLGTFPIMPGGAFNATVPADMPLAIQAVDAEGRAVVSELSWIYTRPGEVRSCVGCHADRNAAPEATTPQALYRRPVNLTLGIDSPQFRANNGANGGVLNLQLERMRETIAVNLHPEAAILEDEILSAVKSETGQKLRPVVRHLVHELQTATEPGRRYAAVQRMGILRPDGIAPVLCEAMRNDSSAEVRMIAALTLAGCATPASTPMLVEALADSFEQVGHAAHITLEHITGHIETESQSPVKDVTSRERKDYWEKWFQNNSPETIEAMNTQFLAGPFDWTHSAASIRFRQAVDALAHYGKSEAVKASLRKVLTEESEIDILSKIAVIRTLGILRDEQSVPLLSDILVDCSEKKTPPAQHSHEFGWTAMPDHIGGAAAEALGRIGTQAAVDALVRGFQTLKEFWFYTFRTADHDWLMGSVSAIIHYRILEALEAIMATTDLDVQKSIDAMADPIIRSIPIDSDRGILLDNDDYERLVGRILARSSLYDAHLEACLNVLEGKPRDTTVMQTVSASPPAVSTGVLEPTSRAAHVIAVLVNDRTSAEHRLRIREAFANFQQREASRERSWTCYMLARALGRLKDKESIPIFLSCLTDEKREFDFGSDPPPNIFLNNAMTPVHRASVAAALGMIGDPATLPVLLAVTEDFYNMMDVRDAAAFAIQEIGRKITPEKKAEVPKDFVQRLKTLAKTYPESYTGKTLSKAHEIWANVP